jgi:hypothetical protein
MLVAGGSPGILSNPAGASSPGRRIKMRSTNLSNYFSITPLGRDSSQLTVSFEKATHTYQASARSKADSSFSRRVSSASVSGNKKLISVAPGMYPAQPSTGASPRPKWSRGGVPVQSGRCRMGHCWRRSAPFLPQALSMARVIARFGRGCASLAYEPRNALG